MLHQAHLGKSEVLQAQGQLGFPDLPVGAGNALAHSQLVADRDHQLPGPSDGCTRTGTQSQQDMLVQALVARFAI